MKNAVMIAQAIYDNIFLIIAFAMICAGIVIRVKKFFQMSKEEQTAKLKEQAAKVVELVEKELLSLVSQAEKNWGAGTGIIKKSEVWGQLLAKQQSLMKYIEEGIIDAQLVDDLIEEAVTELNKHKEQNQKVAEAVTQAAQ